MDPSEREFAAEVDKLEAYLLALEGHPDDALARLDGKDDPESLLRRLEILLEAKRYPEAADLVRGREPHERWCEQAVAALAAVGDGAEAERFVAWAHAHQDPLLWPACLVALARYRFLHGLAGRSERVALLPGELSAAEQKSARRALADVSPLVATARAQRRVLTGIEASAVALALELAYFLNERNEAAGLAQLLWDRKPLPLNYALAVIRKMVPVRPELPDRLRSERGESFEAKRLAAYIEGMLLDRPREAVEAAEQMLREFSSVDHQQQTAILLHELSGALPTAEAEAVRARAEKLLGPDGPHARFKEAESLVKAERYDEALAVLERTPEPNHPSWLELMAAVKSGKGQKDEAVDLLVRATDLMPEDGLLRKAAAVSARCGRTSEAARLMERLLRIDPNDVGIRAHLGDLLVRMGQYERAAEQFHILREIAPDDQAFGLNEAICLSRSLKLEESLRVYDELCAGRAPLVEAVVGRAALLKAMNRAGDGFASLEQHKAAFWDQPTFLKAYITLGYASKRENEAHRGLFHLQQLQSEGSVGQELHPVSLDDLRQMFQQERENEQLLSREVLSGRYPWLLADIRSSQTAVAAFNHRTRALDWLPEDPIMRGLWTIYATNGYVVIKQGDEQRSAEPIRAPEPNRCIVMDLSSLITIHRLGLLVSVAEYFGECLYPSDYRTASLRDLERLVHHQPSRYEAKKCIVGAVDRGAIQVASCEGMPFVHEYGLDDHDPEDEHLYKFADLITPLNNAELLTDATAVELQAIANRGSGVAEGHPPLAQNDEIRVDPSSLESLQAHGLLGAVTSCFRVHLRPDDVSSLRQALVAWEKSEDLREQHESLWAAINADTRFVPVHHTLPPDFQKVAEANDRDPEGISWLPLFSAFIASERGLPLLVDDRVCQMLVHRDRQSTIAAFGTDAVLAALLESGRVSADAAADAYLKLIRWRYRFFIVPSPVMVALAKRSLTSPPGQALRRVARYVQDCMRDPGLFGGPEPTIPPVTMAGKLFLAWTQAVSEFVTSVWMDPEIPEASARRVSEWALTEFLPSPPRSSGPAARIFADLQSQMMLSQAFLRSATCRSSERANGALMTVAGVFGITDRDYLGVLAEVIDAL